MTYWQKVVFAWLYRNAEEAMTYSRLPPEQGVELGIQGESGSWEHLSQTTVPCGFRILERLINCLLSQENCL